jgi:POT family proton-dependent oligopeptide transporter
MAGGGANTAPLLMLVVILPVFSVAELLLSPVGLSLSTKLAPAAFRTQVVALWCSASCSPWSVRSSGG